MKQHYFYLFSFFLIFQENAASTRFQTILKKYQNYTLISENKSLSFLFQSLKLPYKPIYIVPVNNNTDNYDTVSYRGTYINGKATYLDQKKKEDLHQKIFNKKSVDFFGTIATDGYTVESFVSSNEFLDTSKLLLSLKGSYAHSFRRYQLTKKIRYPFYFNLSTDISGMLYFLHEKNFEPGIENNLKVKKRYKKYTQAVSSLTDFDIGIGAGKQINATPLYLALKFEKKLLKHNLINFKLSHETILSIAKLVAKNSYYEHRKHNKVRQMKEQIDSILIKDVAVEMRNLRNISLLEIQKILFSKSPDILYKPQFRIFSVSRLINDISNTTTRHISREYSGSQFKNSRNTSIIKKNNQHFLLNYEHLIGVNAFFNIPLSPSWFIHMHAIRNLVSTDMKIKFINTHADINWDEVLDIRWDFKISAWPVRSFFGQIGIMNIPSWIIVPRKLPNKVYAEIGFFMENNILIKPSFIFFNNKKNNDLYDRWFDHDRFSFQGFIFRISVAYYF